MTDPIDLSIQQFVEAWRLMCAPGPRCATLTGDGFTSIFSGLPIAFFNVAVVTARGVSDRALEAHGRAACRWAADQGVPWLLMLTTEALEPGTDAAATLDRCGLSPIMTLTGMFAQHVSPLARVPDGLDLTVPQDDESCASLVDVNGLAYGMDLEAAKILVGKRSFWNGHAPVLGLVANRPAACAGVLMIDGKRYVALVATDPAQQRRGFAEAAMRRALDVAAQTHGDQDTVLHATDAGRPIYQRMGYQAIASHPLFIEKKFLEGH
jgi:GNAT superfamily N-acetyltransferase